MAALQKIAPLLLIPVLQLSALAQNLQLSEVLVSNDTSVRDEDRRFADWIEIHNPSPDPVDLAGYHLSDDRGDLYRWPCPPLTVNPGSYLIVFATGLDRSDPTQPLHTNFKLSGTDGTVTLTAPDDSVSRILFPPAQFADVSFGFSGDLSQTTSPAGYLASPTPGAANAALLHAGPLVPSVTNRTPGPAEGQLRIEATVNEHLAPVASVSLFYRTGYDPEVELPMALSAGRYRATVPAAAVQPGQMLRWRVVAHDTAGNQTPSPPFPSLRNSDQYYGTVGHDPSLTSPLPVLHRFIQRPSLAERVSGTRGSVYYDGRFYDNIFIRQRGGTAANWPKKSYKMEFNDANHFAFKPGEPLVDEFNLNATYTDKSYLRARLTAEFGLEAGLPSPETFHLRVHQNGAFYSVALFVEQPDRDFLDRNGLDPDGSLYKAGPGSNYTSTTSFEKKTRRHENIRDLQTLLGALRRPGESRDRFVYDNIDLPTQINFLAVVCLTQNIDASDKNHYLYRDTEGTGEWHMLPWDLDLTFGPNALNTDTIVFRNDRNNAAASHPFIGARPHLLHTGKYNLLIESIIAADGPRQMLLRRIRTLTDQFLAAGYFEDRIDQLVGLLADDVPEDRSRWRNNAHFPGRNDPFETAAGFIKSRYLAPRLGYLTETLAAPHPVGMPASQPARPPLEIASLEATPGSGDRLEQFAELHNPNPYAVDLTGWRIRGSIAHRFKPGTVIPAGASLFLSPDPVSFRDRTTGPSGDQGRFVQGPYDGFLPAQGGLVQLYNPADELLLDHRYAGEQSPLQKFLRVTEIFYNPDGQSEASEFIEIKNTSPDTALDLSGVAFTDGVRFIIPDNTSLAPGAHALLVNNPVGFEAVFGPGLPVLGTYDGNLSNGGEPVAINAPDATPVLFFDYNDNWFDLTDGGGAALVLRDESAQIHAFGQSDQWAPAQPTPGTDALAFTFDYQAYLRSQIGTLHLTETEMEQDTDADGVDNWFEFAFAQNMQAPSSHDVVEVAATTIGDINVPALHYTRPANPVDTRYTYTWSDGTRASRQVLSGTETVTPDPGRAVEHVTFTPNPEAEPFRSNHPNLFLRVHARFDPPDDNDDNDGD